MERQGFSSRRDLQENVKRGRGHDESGDAFSLSTILCNTVFKT